MTVATIPSRPRPDRQMLIGIALALALLALAGGAALWAQVSGERGIIPVASSTDIEVRGVEVNTTGETPEEARANGWREAQRIAWERLDGPELPDGRLDSLVSAIVVESESIGPRRYVARLGVIFDRQRAGALLGAGGERARSAPMLTLPVLVSGGTATMFEVRNPWQRAWAEYNFGQSTIDYVRPAGSGGESLLLTYGQTGRRSRAWWNGILDQFGAADVIVPIANLTYEYPGGPVRGHFVARYGPDNRYLGSFDLRVASAAGLPAMLEQAVARFDRIFAAALSRGTLRPDPTLTLENVELTPVVRALLQEAERVEAEAANARAPVRNDEEEEAPATVEPAPVAEQTFDIQVITADSDAYDEALSLIRGTPGITGARYVSTAIGGNSVMRVTYAGELSALADALRQRGWGVNVGDRALGISR